MQSPDVRTADRAPQEPAGPTGFLGLSHLGIVASVGWASFGRPVVAIDPDAGRVGRIERGDLPIHEPGLDDLLTRSRAWLSLSSDPAGLAACPIVFIAYDVPTDDANESDLAPVRALVDAAIPHLAQDVVLVLMSQVPAGFTRSVGAHVQAVRPELRFLLYYQVETLVLGNAVSRYLTPERLILGCPDPGAPLPPRLAAGLAPFNCPILPMSYESAELTKTAINLYLVASVSYANLCADLCEAIGADWSQMVPALRLDARIGPAAYLRPSLGVAGGNLERDVATLQRLCRTHGVDGGFLDALALANERRFDWVHRQLQRYVFSAEQGSTSRPTLGVWGLTYKRDTRSTKNSPALRLIGDLHDRAALRAWDPAVGADDVAVAASITADRDSVLDGCDALLIMTDWPEFARADLDAIRRRMRRALVIDCVGMLESRRAEMAGIKYVAMGR